VMALWRKVQIKDVTWYYLAYRAKKTTIVLMKTNDPKLVGKWDVKYVDERVRARGASDGAVESDSSSVGGDVEDDVSDLPVEDDQSLQEPADDEEVGPSVPETPVGAVLPGEQPLKRAAQSWKEGHARPVQELSAEVQEQRQQFEVAAAKAIRQAVAEGTNELCKAQVSAVWFGLRFGCVSGTGALEVLSGVLDHDKAALIQGKPLERVVGGPILSLRTGNDFRMCTAVRLLADPQRGRLRQCRARGSPRRREG
jgi:hypothetical protein